MEGCRNSWQQSGIYGRADFLTMKKYIFNTVLFIAVLLLQFCSQNAVEIPASEIVAKVGNRIITQQEFIRRVEYTVRPAFCRQDNIIHKKIVLNSLIAEKLFALEEAASDSTAFLQQLEPVLGGRRDQLMRQLLLKEEGFDKVQTDSSDILPIFDRAGRSYRITFFSLENKKQSDMITAMILSEIPFDTLYSRLNPGETMPAKEISWDDQDVPALHQELYLRDVKKGDILGPYIDDDGRYLFVHIEGWKDRLAMGEQTIDERWTKVSEYLTQKKALEKYEGFVTKVMKGKTFTLNEPVYQDLVRFLGPVYLESKDEKNRKLKRQFFGNASDDDVPEFPREFPLDDQAVLLTMNQKPLSIGEFRAMVQRHPLVFRNKKLSASRFPEQLKYAIADLLRDQQLNKVAHQRGYEKRTEVAGMMQMWQDSYQARIQREHIFNQNSVQDSLMGDQMKILKNILDPYTQQLQKKYSDQIEINMVLLNSIALSNIDLLVVQPGQPFPIIVPSFPVYTTHSKLDYGRLLIP